MVMATTDSVTMADEEENNSNSNEWLKGLALIGDSLWPSLNRGVIPVEQSSKV